MSDTPPGYGELPPELNPRGPGAQPGGSTPWSAPSRTVAKRTRGQRIAGWVAAVTSVAVLLAAGGLWVIYNSIFGNIAHINAFDALAKNGIHRPAKDAKAQNFLLVGSDTRAGANAVYQAAAGSKDNTGTTQRSDTMMLVHIPSGPAKASIISFPRDSWVTIPAWTDSKGAHHPQHQAKLNSAFAEGGSALLVATLEKLSGIRVNHVVQIDFTGFKNMVNALGGITVCVKTTRHDKDSGDYLTAGAPHVIKGDAALAFVRDRKGLPGGDIDRIADQQYFLSVVLHKVLSAGTLTNPPKLYKFARAAAKSMTTDSGFGIQQMKTFATRLRSIDPQHVTFLQVPILNSSARIAGQSVVALDTAKLPTLFAAMKDNTGQPTVKKTTASPKKPSAPLIVKPTAIRVRVSNGTGRAHLAVQTAQSLHARGFTTTTSGNAKATPKTVVYYGTGYADSARTLAASVPGAVTKLDTSLGRTLSLVLGDNFTSVVSVTMGKHSTAPKKTTAPAKGAAAVVAKAPTAAQATCAP